MLAVFLSALKQLLVGVLAEVLGEVVRVPCQPEHVLVYLRRGVLVRVAWEMLLTDALAVLGRVAWFCSEQIGM